jgi:quercetin dioxygenase-like cupin family protein
MRGQEAPPEGHSQPNPIHPQEIPAMTAASGSRETGPFDLSATPIHLGQADANQAALPIPGFGFDGPSFEAYTRAHCSEGAPGRLPMVESSPSDRPVWECHPEGDEIVVVLEGKGTFLQEIDGEERRMTFSPGTALINPAGVWHTANVEQAMKAIYLTPCPGTRHRER